MIISTVSDEADSDEDMRKEKPPKCRIFSGSGAGSAEKICRTVTLCDALSSQDVASSQLVESYGL